MPSFSRAALLAASLIGLGAATTNAELIYGMTAPTGASTAAGTNLVFFDSATPGTQTTVGAFTGLVAGHTLREIDFRPATGTLYALSTSATGIAQVYTVNLSTGSLTPAGSSFTLTGATSAVASMDFNPAADALRIVTRGGESYRWSPQTNSFIAADTRIAYVAGDPNGAGVNPDLIGVAYNNNVAGAGSTTLFGWDYQTDSLVRIGGVGGSLSPNTGQAFSLSSPTATLTGNAGFDLDISGLTGFAYSTHDDPATGTIGALYRIDLSNGTETLVGAYGNGVFINSLSVLSVLPVPEPGSLVLAGAGVAGLVFLRRRGSRSARA